MIYGMYSIYDKVTGNYSEPFLAVNNATAERRFNYTMEHSKMISADCQLYMLGEFDSSIGVINAVDKPIFICNYDGGL